MKKKVLSVFVAIVMVMSLSVNVFASAATELPRNETLYIAGLQWGAINGWNAFSADMNNALAVTQQGQGTRVTMFETLYMYNMLDNSMVPLLAEGDYVWSACRTSILVNLNPNAKWSDGTPVTARDVIVTAEMSMKYMNTQGAAFEPFIESILAFGDHAIVINAKMERGVPANPLMLLQFLTQPYILQADWLLELEARNNGNGSAMLQDPAEDIPYSGPYGPFFADDTRIILIRNENYWGQHASMWGKLPVPKYLAHPVFEDNSAGDLALRAGMVDVSQQFTANVQNYWLVDGLPISTFMDEPPYGIGSSLPTAYFNMGSYGLDNVYIRRAIALAVDYDAIIANAMTNQSATFQQVPRSLMNPTAAEQATFDSAAVAHLQWAGNDIELANKILDDAGILRNADGRRELDGVVLSYTALAPQGWSDWEAAMEIVAAAGELIGIEIVTLFPDWSVYQTVVTTPQNDYDIFMMWTDSSSPSQPWGRIRQLMSSEFPPLDSNWSGNWGHFTNARIDEIIRLIPIESDPDVLTALYTEAVEIYLTYVPSFTLMYRPANFHVVNESVWTGFTEYGDGRNVPPLHATDGYAIADLYNIRLVR